MPQQKQYTRKTGLTDNSKLPPYEKVRMTKQLSNAGLSIFKESPTASSASTKFNGANSRGFATTNPM